MSQMTDYLEGKLLDHTLGKAAFAMPGTVYLALFTASPTDAGSMAAEVGGGVGYARQAITAGMSAASSPGGGSSNTATITFGPATGAWGTVTHIGLCDNATIGAGNMLMWGALSATKTIASGDSLQFATGNLSITFS